MTEADRALTVEWGNSGKGGAVMPGRRRILARDYAPEEAAAPANAGALGARTRDAFLNTDAF